MDIQAQKLNFKCGYFDGKSGYFHIYSTTVFNVPEGQNRPIFDFIFDPRMVNFEQNMVFYAILIQLKNEFNLKIRFNSTS